MNVCRSAPLKGARIRSCDALSARLEFLSRFSPSGRRKTCRILPKGFKSVPYRSTDGTVFSVVEGKGKTVITGPDGGKVTFAWGPRDTFVVPSWLWHSHETDGDAVLFSFSDRPAQDKLGLWREMRGN